MEIKRYVLGDFLANGYLLISGDEAVFIDPGEERVVEEVKKLGIEIKAIINTHGHIDHIEGNEVLREAFGAELYIHRHDIPFLSDATLNLSSILGKPKIFSPPTRILEGGEKITLNHEKLLILHTPGHTPGSIAIVGDGFIFTGDTVSSEGIGRTDLFMGSFEELKKSLRMLLDLEDDLLVYPGHGEPAYLGEIKKIIKGVLDGD